MSGTSAPDGGWQTDLRTSNPAVPIDGPQWVLEYWSHLNHVFQFVRVEDLAYDKRPGHGERRLLRRHGPRDRRHSAAGSIDERPHLEDGARSRRPDAGRLAVHPPRRRRQRGQDAGRDPSAGQHRDDEDGPPRDRGSGWQQPVPREPIRATRTRPRRACGTSRSRGLCPGRRQDRSVGRRRPDGCRSRPHPDPPLGNWGSWETTGIVDASAAFGTGAYLINVQAHTLWIEKEAGPDTFLDPNADPDFTYKREGGQLLLIRIPGI